MSDTRELLRTAAETIRELRAENERLRRDRFEAIAVVGAGCRLPGGVHDTAALRNLLRSGSDAVGEIPASRWNADAYFDADPSSPGKTNSRWGGFIDGIDLVDREFFGFSPREASRIDPQHRLFLEVAWEAIEDAGLTVAALRRAGAGIFLGITGYDYYHLQLHDADMHSASGNGHSFAGARLAHLFDFHGPNIAVDTACSSSLVAVHLACASLRAGDCDIALAGGVNLVLTPETSIAIAKTCALSSDGRCKSFDAGANGFVRSDGCAVVALKRLSDALADGDPIRAVIRGSAVNHDGRAAGITAPNGAAQEAVLRKALRASGVSEADVTYIEAHGSATAFGDAIELETLKNVYGAAPNGSRRCAVGSIKSAIGHPEAAAGVAGLVNAIAAMEHGEIPGVLHLREVNPRTPLDATRLFVPKESVPWPAPRTAAVSSFGFSGTNAHLIVSAPPERTIHAPLPRDPMVPALLPLSARSGGALRAMAERWSRWLRETRHDVADIAHTAARRRTHHRYRLAVSGHTRAEWAGALEAWLRGETDPPNDVAALYVSGGDVSWNDLVPVGQHVSLPAYPWQRERAWLVQPATRVWESVLAPEAPAYLGDHRVDGRTLVPAAAHLAMALAAAEEALPAGPKELSGVEFHAPLFLADGAASRVRLSMDLRKDGWADFEILTRAEDAAVALPWRRLASGRARTIAAHSAAHSAPAADARCEEPVAAAAHYRRLAARSIELGPSFRCLAEIRRGSRQALSRIDLAPALAGDGEHVVHPVCLDACFQNLAVALDDAAEADGTFLPVRVERLVLHRRDVPRSVFGRLTGARDAREAAEEVTGEAHLLAASGDVIVSLEGVRIRRIEPERERDLLYGIEWERVEPAPDNDAANWIFLFGNARHAGDLQRELRARVDARPHVVFVADAERDGDPVSAGEAACARLIALVQELATQSPPPRLTIVTRHAQLLAGDAWLSSAQAMLWGIGRVVANEHPELDCCLVDTARQTNVRTLAAILRTSGEPQLVLRGDAAFAPRLAPLAAPRASRALVRSGATYLITGGAGALGLEVADRLARRGAEHIVLVGRSEPAECVRHRIDAIAESTGARIHVRRIDVADADAVHALVGELRRTLPPLRGVVHAAGALRDALLTNQTPATLHDALEGKARGAWNLHCALEGAELDFFLLFSSLSGLLGRPSQANYAAASAFLDALALERRQRGLPALSIDWGPWSEVGMAVPTLAQSAAAGVHGLAAGDALAALELLARSDTAHAAVASLDRDRLAQALGRVPLLQRWTRRSGSSDVAAPESIAPAFVEEYLLDRLASMLGVARDAIAPDVSISNHGLDSLMALELREAVAADFGVTLPLVHLLKGLSIAELAREIATKRNPTTEQTEDEWQTLRI